MTDGPTPHPKAARGPYSPPTGPSDLPPALNGVKVTTAPVRIVAEPEPPTDDNGDDAEATSTGAIAVSTLVSGTKQLRRHAEERRSKVAGRVASMREQWEERQRRLVALREEAQRITGEMNELAAQMDPLVVEHERLAGTVRSYDATLEMLVRP
jgi:hypothetical protein